MVNCKAFQIPNKYSLNGGNVSIPISIDNATPEVKSRVILLIDKSAMNFIHWAVIDLPSDVLVLPEGVSNTPDMKGIELVNNYGSKGYGGMCPPVEDGLHTYELNVIELGCEKLPDNPSWIDLSNFVSQDSSMQPRYQSYTINRYAISGVFKTEI